MDIFYFLASVCMTGIVSGLYLSLKLRKVRELREQNSIKALRYAYMPMEIYDLGPDEWEEVDCID